jgi:hypothetical protein
VRPRILCSSLSENAPLSAKRDRKYKNPFRSVKRCAAFFSLPFFQRNGTAKLKRLKDPSTGPSLFFSSAFLKRTSRRLRRECKYNRLHDPATRKERKNSRFSRKPFSRR